MKHTIIFLILASSTFYCSSAPSQKQVRSTPPVQTLSEPFDFTLEKPFVRIQIPELPQIKLEKHPLADTKPHLRYMGTLGLYNISINTPTADNGMTAEECATSIIGSVIARNGLEKGKYSVLKSEDTFGLFYGIKIGEVYQMNAYLVSATPDNYCVEVHISKITQESTDIFEWKKGMPKATILTKR